jgi:16S rRNA C967 or C1407 C5-methylase (RsmB/RsmF family)
MAVPIHESFRRETRGVVEWQDDPNPRHLRVNPLVVPHMEPETLRGLSSSQPATKSRTVGVRVKRQNTNRSTELFSKAGWYWL